MYLQDQRRVSGSQNPDHGDCELEFLTFEDDEEAKRTFRHTASHILAQAVKRLYPEAKLAIGPSIANGFYYDFDVEKPFLPEDLEKIEAEMKKIVKEKLPLERFEMIRTRLSNIMRIRAKSTRLSLLRSTPTRARTSASTSRASLRSFVQVRIFPIRAESRRSS